MSTAYKCKSCGAPLRFDPHTGKLRCDHCDADYLPYEYHRSRLEKETVPGEEKIQIEGDIAIYHCPNCGAEILSADTAIADRCVYCGYPVAFAGTLTDEFVPDFLLPFEKDISDAVSEYRNVLKNAPFAPKEFREKSALERFRGVYVPVWLYTMDVEAEINVRGRVDGKKILGFTDYGPITQECSEMMTVHEEGIIHYENIARDGLMELDDLVVRCLSPYDYWKRMAFDPSYLAGFYAQRWDVDFEACRENVRREVLNAAAWDIREHACDLGESYADHWRDGGDMSYYRFSKANAKRRDYIPPSSGDSADDMHYTQSSQVNEERRDDSKIPTHDFIRTSNRLDPDGGFKVLGNNVLPPNPGTDFRGQIIGERVEYALVPVWLMYTRYKDKDYMFAMNGQTGEIDGNMPVSILRVLAYFGIMSLVILAIVMLDVWLNAQPDMDGGILAAAVLPILWFLNLVRKQSSVKLMEKNAEPVRERMYRRRVHEEK